MVVVIRGGGATREDQEVPYGQLRVRPTVQNKSPFDIQKKDIFLDTHHEFVNGNQASTSTVVRNEGPILGTPQRFEHLF